MYNEITKHKTAGNITTLCWQDITDFQIYYVSVTPTLTTTQIMDMTPDVWDAVDVTIMRMNSTLAATILATAAVPVITAATVTSTQIDADVFGKYYNVKLPGKVEFKNSMQIFSHRPLTIIFSYTQLRK